MYLQLLRKPLATLAHIMHEITSYNFHRTNKHAGFGSHFFLFHFASSLFSQRLLYYFFINHVFSYAIEKINNSCVTLQLLRENICIKNLSALILPKYDKTDTSFFFHRGRYDIKVFQTFFQLHGKTFDYKIPMSTVLRLFLLPHKDTRQMFFVVSLDPPIKQGQTRYHYLVLLFGIEEETSLELPFTE